MSEALHYVLLGTLYYISTGNYFNILIICIKIFMTFQSPMYKKSLPSLATINHHYQYLTRTDTFLSFKIWYFKAGEKKRQIVCDENTGTSLTEAVYNRNTD